MADKRLDIGDLHNYELYLWGEERSGVTIEKYMRDIGRFYEFLGADHCLSKERVIAYKNYLGRYYKSSSANSMLASVNGLLIYLGFAEFRVRSFKNQRQIFCEASREMSKQEYERMIAAARKNGNYRLEMIMQTICGTGIRIGELSFITVEAVHQGQAAVISKGKNRVVFFTPQLRCYLLGYCERERLEGGPIFVTRGGKPVNRSNVWSEMKHLCQAAGVDSSKVFPHNLRHLFARTCYQKQKDIVYLADILGHSSVDTTRIYTVSSGVEHRKMLESLHLIV